MAAAAASGLGNPQPAREQQEEEMLRLSLSPVAAAEEGLSDAETASSSSTTTTAARGAPNSSLSSGSSLERCSSCLSRLSLDCSPSASLAPSPSPSPAAACRPHRSSDPAWAAIRAASLKSPLGPPDFKLVRRVGGGDIGTVYLCRLLLPHGGISPCLYAMKVVDRRRVAGKKKPERERRILRRLDHPFLPTLFADFDAAPHLSCVVTEFCPGGDLHSLLLRRRRLPLPSARFYAAEVLAALEYLHMMGIVYRDLKPENVLIRADGHVMLTDFDLSLQSVSAPFLLHDDADEGDDEQPTTTLSSCFPRRRRKKREPRVVAEPVAARSRSLVGTHEYVAPEVASGKSHGAAVDWWALGVLLYELLHGRTPFAGTDNEATLRNVVSAPLAFPPSLSGGAMDGGNADARDLIARLLAKDPAARLGARRGAADVKAHRFFRGVNFALLRSARPPVVPVPGGGHIRRSQSCKAPPRPDPSRFDLF